MPTIVYPEYSMSLTSAASVTIAATSQLRCLPCKRLLSISILHLHAVQDGKENSGRQQGRHSTGVYVACVWQEYQVLLEHLHITPTAAVLTGSGMNFMIGRVSYTLGLQGVLHTLSIMPCLHTSVCMSPDSNEPYWASVHFFAGMARSSHWHTLVMTWPVT